MTLKQLTALRSMVVNRFNHWDEGMNSYFEEPMCKLLLELIDAEIERHIPHKNTFKRGDDDFMF